MPEQENRPGSPVDLGQLGNRLQELHQSLSSGGSYTERYRQFEQIFNVYTTSLISLIRNPVVRPILRNTSNNKSSVYFMQHIDEGGFNSDLPFGWYFIELNDKAEQIELVLYSTYPSATDNDDITKLNLNLPSNRGNSFVKNNTYRYGGFGGNLVSIALRPLEAADLLSPIRFSDNTLFNHFIKGANYILNRVNQTMTTQMSTMQEGITQMTIEQVFSDAVNPPTSSVYHVQPLTEARVREIVDEAIREHPVIKRLEAEGVTKGQLRTLVEAVIDTHQPSKPGDRRKKGRQLTDAEIASTVDRYGGTNPEARSAIEQFIRERVKTATDPERVLAALLAIIGGFVPGAAKIVAIVQAANILFSKKVTVEDAAYGK